MPEPIAVAETEQTSEWSGTSLSDVFDTVFPSTAEAKPDPAEASLVDPPPDAAPTPPEPPSKPTDAAPTPSDDLLPDAAFEDKPPVPPTPPKEYEAPENVKKDAKAFANWNELRKAEETNRIRAEKAESLAAELQKKVESAPTDEGLMARLAEAEATAKELSDRVASVDLQSHPQFRRQFVEPRDTAVANAVAIVKDAGGDPAALEHAMSLTGKAKIEALDEIVEGISSPTLRGQISAIVTQVNEIDRQRAACLANAKGNVEALRKQDVAMHHRALAEHEKNVNGYIDGLSKHMADKSIFFRPIPGNDKWNASLEAHKEEARELALKTADEGKLLGALLCAVKFPIAEATLVATQKRLKAVLAENAELKGADPSLNGSRSDAGEPGLDPNLSFAESVARGSGLR